MLANPVALERLEYDAKGGRVKYRSDTIEGPSAGSATVDPLEFLARLVTHIPHKHQVMTRYYSAWGPPQNGQSGGRVLFRTATNGLTVVEEWTIRFPLEGPVRRWRYRGVTMSGDAIFRHAYDIVDRWRQETGARMVS